MKKEGSLAQPFLESVLDSLPFDLTIIDGEDRVVAWTNRDRRLFDIKDEILGTDLRKCHSESSIGTLNEMLEGMKEGRIDSTRSFKGVQKGGVTRRFMVQYIAVRDETGAYLGCIEVDMDLSDLPGSDEERSSY